MIGKGVRFNAEKKASKGSFFFMIAILKLSIYIIFLTPLVGKFHSTRLWEFSMRCHLCPNKIIVKTDPENCDYIMDQGAYKIV
jgi:hypothetical protein